MRPHGALLDVDGTLLDSNDAHARAWAEALAEHGVEVRVEEVRRLIGMGGDKLLPRLSGLEEESARGEAILERRKQIFLERHLPSLRPTPGARALVERMRDAGLSLTIATSAGEEELGPLLERAGVADLVHRRTSSDDADRSKPDPDIVVAALRRAKLAPEHAILIGDTPYDVEAAARAGVRTIAVRCGGWDDAALAGAIAIYDDPAALLAEYARSPLA